MAEPKEGGPAFPIFDPQAGCWHGLTLRDYFAAHAPGIPQGFGRNMDETGWDEVLVRWRWHYADAMLAARAPKEKS